MSKPYKSSKLFMFLDQVMNEKRIADCILISLGLESYVNLLPPVQN
jgi:hypothetical protein